MNSISSYESMQFLAEASIELEKALKDVSGLDALFIRTTGSKVAFEPKLAGRFSRAKNLLTRAFKPQSFDLEKHLVLFQKHFEAASKLEPKEYAKLQAIYGKDLEKMVNTFKERLEKIQTHAQVHAKDKLRSREKAKRLGTITFCPITTEEACLDQLKQKLNTKIEKVASRLLTFENPDHELIKEFERIKEKAIPTGMQVDTSPIQKTFCERVMEVHAAKLSVIQKEFEESLQTKLTALLEQAHSAQDLDRILDEYTDFVKKNKPPGLKAATFEIPHTLLNSKKETLKAKAIAAYEELLKNKLEEMAKNPKKFTSLDAVIKHFKQFAKDHKPKEISEQEFTSYYKPRIKDIKNQLSQQLASAFKAMPRDQPIFTTGALAKSIAQITFEVYMKGCGGLQSSVFLFTLAAPYLTTYASNKLLPDTVVPVTVRNFVQSFSTLWLYREAFPNLLSALKSK